MIVKIVDKIGEVRCRIAVKSVERESTGKTRRFASWGWMLWHFSRA